MFVPDGDDSAYFGAGPNGNPAMTAPLPRPTPSLAHPNVPFPLASLLFLSPAAAASINFEIGSSSAVAAKRKVSLLSR